MNNDDRDVPDPVLAEWLARGDSVAPLRDGFTDDVLSALRQRSLVRSEPTRRGRILFAASWFLAGIGVGLATQFVVTRQAPASATVATVEAADLPEVWY